MILVLFLSILLINLFIILFCYLKIKAENVEIFNTPNFSYNFVLKIGIYLFNRYKLFEYSIDKNKIKKTKIFNKFKEQIFNKDFFSQFSQMPSLSEFKKLQTNMENIDLNIKIGTESVLLTSALVAIISSGIGIFLGRNIKEYNKEKHDFEILPIYQNKNYFELHLNCIIHTKLVHIIYVIYMFSKKRSGKKNERTSNRRSYDYSYE